MRGRPASFVATVVMLLGLTVVAAPPAPAAQAQSLPKAYVLVDADTGAVLAQQDSRTLRSPASTIKLLTALIASQRLQPTDPIPISPVAEAMPALKINVKASQVWAYEHLMRSMLMVSANDAAVALAEKVGGGTLDGYVTVANETVARLGLVDHPILNDPAGLDDEFANKGGDRISPRDLAIVARAVLASPSLMAIIGTRDYSFTGGDRLPHHLPNHDLFLDMYPGANGLKTGTTELAGRTFVGSATRERAHDAGGRVRRRRHLRLGGRVAGPRVQHSGLRRSRPRPPASGRRRRGGPTTAPDGSRGFAVGDRCWHGRLDLRLDPFALLVLVLGLLPLRALRRRVIARHLPDEHLDDLPPKREARRPKHLATSSR